ncbi:MAG: hypothetical protein JO187_03170 [Acidobacteria bacterium]|nr:hypothetical protein [Acidobacteriota bacterium]
MGGIRRAIAVLAIVVMTGAMTIGFAADKPQTFTGTVSDAMCGAKHQMANSAECTRACIGHGAKYALVVGDKVYTLEGGDKAQLDKLAGEKATVKGTVSGDTINVASVSAAKS